jgi:hypothetical protein
MRRMVRSHVRCRLRSRRGFDRRCTGRRHSAARPHVRRTAARILGACGIARVGGVALDHLAKQSLEVGPAPTTASAGAEAVAKLPGPFRPLDAQKVHDLALRDMKAEANFVVEVHSVIVLRGPIHRKSWFRVRVVWLITALALASCLVRAPIIIGGGPSSGGSGAVMQNSAAAWRFPRWRRAEQNHCSAAFNDALPDISTRTA